MVFKDKMIVEAEIGALELHVVRIDGLPVERIAEILAQELEQLSVTLLHSASVRIEHNLPLIHRSILNPYVFIFDGLLHLLTCER